MRRLRVRFRFETAQNRLCCLGVGRYPLFSTNHFGAQKIYGIWDPNTKQIRCATFWGPYNELDLLNIILVIWDPGPLKGPDFFLPRKSRYPSVICLLAS